MKIKTVIISLLVIALMITSFLCANVNASAEDEFEFNSASDYWDFAGNISLLNLEYLSKKEVQGTTTNYSFNTVAEKNYVSLFFIGKTSTQANNGYFYLIAWHDDILNVDNFSGRLTTTNNETIYYTRTTTIDEVDQIVFGDYEENDSIDVSTGTVTYVFQTIFSDKINGGYANNGEGDFSIVKRTTEEYYLQNILGIQPEEPDDDEDKGILETLKDILKEIKDKLHLNPLNPGMIIFDNASSLINEKLSNNDFYVSIMKIKVELEDLLNEDYTSRTGFYELNLPINNFSLGRIQGKKYVDVGNEVIGSWEQEFNSDVGSGTINWGIKNVNLLNFDWFFGKDLGGGYYTKGVKEYSDMVIGSFLWLVFAYWLWHNLPDLIMGEIGTVGSMVASEYSSIVAEDERIEWNNQREAQREARIAERNAEREHRKSYDYYKENRARSEAYSARYHQEKREAKKK